MYRYICMYRYISQSNRIPLPYNKGRLAAIVSYLQNAFVCGFGATQFFHSNFSVMIGFYVSCVGILGISTLEIRPVSYSDISPNKQAAYYKHAVKEYWSRCLPKVFDLIPRSAASPFL